MIWVDRVVKKLKERSLDLEWVDDMKTPSGRIHVGSLRGVIIHDLVYKVLQQNEVKSEFSYVFNDLDPMDAIPSYLEFSKWQKYEGVPLCNVPSPEEGFKSFAEYYALEFKETFERLNCHPKIIWSSELYRSGKMNDVIKEILDSNKTVLELYKKVTKAHKPEDWYPIQAICENCGKIGTTQVHQWDGKHIYYKCHPHLVKWAAGCGHEGKTTPYDGKAKLVWRLDWPAHWKVIGVTIEGSGKDHMSAGGSYDLASVVSKEILKREPPYAIPYEWFTVGGKKMSSSKGIGISAKEVSGILPPDVFRFFIVRTPIETHLDFNPYGESILKIFDDYDRCLNAYFDKLENNIPKGKQGEVLLDYARIAELSQARMLPEKRLYLPRFRTIVNLIKSHTDLLSFFEKLKKSPLTPEEKKILEERELFAQVYIKNYAAPEEHNHITGHAPKKLDLSPAVRLFFTELLKGLETNPSTRDQIQELVVSILSKYSLKPRDVFKTFYLVMIGKEFGPKAADVILDTGLGKVKKRLAEVLNTKIETGTETNMKHLYPTLTDSNIFSVDPAVKEKFPSVSVGIAIIKGVTIKKNAPALQIELNTFLNSLSTITTEEINTYPEVLSYRKLYKEMKVDWHSRRPSPEALLRRIATKKRLYNVNTCVDAYNLVVMKNRVSVGAFDLDKIKFPTVLRFPKPGEKILLLGDTEPTEYEPTELAYFDKTGGYNIDFNYRDAQRTAVRETTKNILLNVDGVYDVDRQKVEQSLKESVEIIQKYCGGKVEITAVS